MKTATALPPLRSVKVLDQLRERATCITAYQPNRLCPLGSCLHPFHGGHPATLGSSEVEAFLSWLANERKVSVSTHRQALAALLFFYGKVLCTDLPWLQEIGRPRPSRRLPVVLTPDEVVRILGFLEGEHRLFAQPVWNGHADVVRVCNCGSRIWISITARSSCGRARAPSDRALMLPESLAPSLREQLSRARGMVAEGPGPRAAAALRFPTPLSGSIRAPGIPGRGSGFLRSTRIRPIHGAVSCVAITCDQTFQRAFKRAVEQAGITKPPPHTLRHSFATASAAVATFEPCRICSAIPTSLRR